MDDGLALADIITNALQASEIGIAVFDRQLELLSFNPAYARLHGFGNGRSYCGKLMHDVFADSHLKRRIVTDESRPSER
ncbi:hypothetical protein N9H93_04635, partial [Rhizobiaceae bacterium]|nr:hypothetical protein [Rhizobiaceae bacterium]